MSAHRFARDLRIGAGTSAIPSNHLIGDFDSFPASAINNGTLSDNPGFTGSFDFRPRADSVLRDSGASASGQLAIDLDGHARVQGRRIDRGDHEFPEVFGNGFE